MARSLGQSTATRQTTSRPIINNTNAEVSYLFPRHFASQQNTRKHKVAVKKCREIVRRFVCLADKEQIEAPDSEEQGELLTAGVGEAKLALLGDFCVKDLRELLLASFIKLDKAEGFELMYAEANTREHKDPLSTNKLPLVYQHCTYTITCFSVSQCAAA